MPCLRQSIDNLWSFLAGNLWVTVGLHRVFFHQWLKALFQPSCLRPQYRIPEGSGRTGQTMKQLVGRHHIFTPQSLPLSPPGHPRSDFAQLIEFPLRLTTEAESQLREFIRDIRFWIFSHKRSEASIFY